MPKISDQSRSRISPEQWRRSTIVGAVDAITTKNALIDYSVRQGLLADRRAGDAWLRDPWYRVTVRGHAIPAVPLYGFKRPLILHDIHHLVTGYPTDLWGEMALAGWELGSGGCGRYPVFWLVQLSFFVTALALMPSLALRAFASGRKLRNLYRFDPEEVLSQTIDAIRTYVAGGQETTPASGASPESPWAIAINPMAHAHCLPARGARNTGCVWTRFDVLDLLEISFGTGYLLTQRRGLHDGKLSAS